MMATGGIEDRRGSRDVARMTSYGDLTKIFYWAICLDLMLAIRYICSTPEQ